ncbi:MAG: hypothetical protein V4641_21285 [Pseudomonadota bacterium]
MAGTNIGNLSVMLSTNTVPFDKGIENATTKIQQFSQLANSVKAGGISGIVQALGNIGGLNLSRPLESIGNLLSNIPGGVGKFFGTITNAILPLQELFKALTDLIEVGRQQVKELDEIRKRYALTGTAAAGMRLAVIASGGSMEDAARPLGRLARALGQAGGGAVEAQQNFRRLGLDGLALSRLPFDQSLEKIARRFREIRDPGERAARAASLFGREWQQALVTIDKFADIEKFKQLATYFNASVDAAGMRRFQENKESRQALAVRTQATSQGVMQQLYLTAAPVLTFLQNAGSRALEFIQPFLREIVKFIQQAYIPLEALIGVIDGIAEAFKPLWQAVMEGFTEIDKTFKELFGGTGIAELLKGITVWVLSFGKPIIEFFVAGVKGLTKDIKTALAAIREGRDWLQNAGSTVTFGLISRASSPTATAAGGGDEERLAHLSELREEIGKSTKQMNAQAAALGGASNAMAIYELRQRGATDAMIQQLQVANASLHTAQTIQGLRDQQNQLLMTADAWQRYRLEREGASAADLAAVERLQFRGQVIQTLLRNLQSNPTAGGGATEGSREALAAIQQYQMAGERRNLQEEVRDAIIEVRDTERANGELLRQVRDAIQAAPETRTGTGTWREAFDAMLGPRRS